MHVTGLHRPLRKDDTPLDGGSRLKQLCVSLEVGRRVLRISWFRNGNPMYCTVMT